MRATVGYLACLAAGVSSTAWPSEPSPIYLRGYYTIQGHYLLWQHSDSSPWYVMKDAPWANPRLVEWGYVPVTHNAQNYYCVIDHGPPTGSLVPLRTFACGDPATVEQLYDSKRAPFGLSY
jgi:hypothetical protein